MIAAITVSTWWLIGAGCAAGAITTAAYLKGRYDKQQTTKPKDPTPATEAPKA